MSVKTMTFSLRVQVFDALEEERNRANRSRSNIVETTLIQHLGLKIPGPGYRPKSQKAVDKPQEEAYPDLDYT